MLKDLVPAPVRLLIHSINSLLLRLLAFPLGLFETVLFLLLHPHLLRHQRIFVCWHWSFGHTIESLDMVSRRYDAERTGVIYFPTQGANPHLAHLFDHTFDVAVFRSHLLPWRRPVTDVMYNWFHF